MINQDLPRKGLGLELDLWQLARVFAGPGCQRSTGRGSRQ